MKALFTVGQLKTDAALPVLISLIISMIKETAGPTSLLMPPRNPTAGDLAEAMRRSRVTFYAWQKQDSLT